MVHWHSMMLNSPSCSDFARKRSRAPLFCVNTVFLLFYCCFLPKRNLEKKDLLGGFAKVSMTSSGESHASSKGCKSLKRGRDCGTVFQQFCINSANRGSHLCGIGGRIPL